MFGTKPGTNKQPATKADAAKPRPGEGGKVKDAKYERKKLREAERQRKLSATGRDIGELPDVVDPARKDACRRDFQRFCVSYFPDVFKLAWSNDHLEVIAAIERTVLEGGMFALAMPRGSGKTSLCEVACIWAAVYGHHKFVLLIGADAEAATDSLESVRTLLETNEVLGQDFPEVCFPIAKLEGVQQRRLLYRGQRVRIKFTKASLLLPDVPGSAAASVIFQVAGITGRIRGRKYVRPDGTSARPTLCLIDDPQTDESASSETMTKNRLKVVTKAVRGLAGPGKKIAALMPCTVIQRGDMADQVLDRAKHPAWHGRRFKLLLSWPKRMDLWEQYVQIRFDCLRAEEPTTRATNFYSERQAIMDEGAAVAWPERFEPDEISAIQNVMNLRFESPEASEEAFLCEYQNEPPDQDDPSERLPTLEVLMDRVGKLGRQEIPDEVAHVFASIDVQGHALFWELDGFETNFTNHLLDYNAFPEQPTGMFAYRTIAKTLESIYPGGNTEGRIYQALTDLVGKLVGLEFRSQSGQVLRVAKIGIDSSFNTRLIHRFCRESEHAPLLIPTHGRSITERQTPMRNYRVSAGEQLYTLSMLTKGNAKARTTRHLVIDTNAVKTFIFERFKTRKGDGGAVSFFCGHPVNHKLYCEHLRAESRKGATADGRYVEVWTLKPGKPDNHWLDTRGIVYALADAAGCRLDIPAAKQKPKRAPRVIEAEYL